MNCEFCGSKGKTIGNKRQDLPGQNRFNRYCKPCDNYFAGADQLQAQADAFLRERGELPEALLPEAQQFWTTEDGLDFKAFLMDSNADALEELI